MTIREQDHERARRADAFRRQHFTEISEEIGTNGRQLRTDHDNPHTDGWECFAATGKIGDYLEFVKRRENGQ